MSTQNVWSFAKSTDRTTAPTSPSPPASISEDLRVTRRSLPQLTHDDISTVYPLLMLGQGFVPAQSGLVHTCEQTRPSSPTGNCGKRCVGSERGRYRPPRAASRPETTLDLLALCAIAQLATAAQPAPLHSTLKRCAPDVMSSPPTERDGDCAPRCPSSPPAGAVDPNSSLPSPPLSPRLGGASPLVSLTDRVHVHGPVAFARKHRVCISCGVRQTPCWRPSWSPREGQLCNSCGLRFRKSRARCVSPHCARIPARTELAAARASAQGQRVRCLNCKGVLVFYSSTK